MKIIPGGVTAPAGFRAAGLHVGIRRNKLKKDMALLVSDVPAHVAGAFTQNMVQAAPVIYDRQLCQNVGMCQALVVNSGVANTCTGEQGIHDAEAMAAHVGKSLGIDPSTVAVASTGVIGMRLPMDVIQSGIDMLVPELSYSIDAGVDAAEAIKTTDIYKKEIAVTLEIKGAAGHHRRHVQGIRNDQSKPWDRTQLHHDRSEYQLRAARQGAEVRCGRYIQYGVCGWRHVYK